MPKRILIVDDEKQITDIMKTLLQFQGYQVLTLNSSKNVLDFVRENEPDLIILDIKMPGEDGYQVCDKIKSEYSSGVPIIVSTAKSDEKEIIEKAHQFYGADDYILKPFDTQELFNKIAKFIS